MTDFSTHIIAPGDDDYVEKYNAFVNDMKNETTSSSGALGAVNAAVAKAKEYRDEAEDFRDSAIGGAVSNLTLRQTVLNPPAVHLFAPNKLVDTLAGDLSFTCASERRVINRSGILETVAVNDPAVGADGVWFHTAYTNIMTNSEDLALWSANGISLSIDNSYELDYIKLTEDTTEGSHSSTYGSSIAIDAGTYTMQYYVHKDSTRNARLRLGTTDEGQIASAALDVVTGVVTTHAGVAGAKDYGDYYLFWVTGTSVGGSTSNSGMYMVSPSGELSYKGDGSGFLLTAARQLTKTTAPLPYIKTESTAVSVAKTNCRVDNMNNFPAVGQPFTISLIADVPLSVSDNISFFGSSSNVTTGTILFRKVVNGPLVWYHDKADGTDAILYITDTAYISGRRRYTLKFANGRFVMFCDGTLVGERTADDYCWFEMTGHTEIGANLGSTVEGFKVYHEDIADETIEAWGGV
jgi:hypothetical protein